MTEALSIDVVGEMPITLQQLVRHYPFVYHMAERDALPQLLRHGLLSTTAILDLFGIQGERRRVLELCVRKESAVLEHPVHGRITLRDQKPLSATKLAGCLQDGLSTEDWLRLLNRKTYFWLGRDKVETLLGGRAYRQREHIVIEVGTGALVHAHGDRVTLAAMNTGSTSPFAHKRGLSTLLPMSEFPYQDRRNRGLRPATELCVDHSVPDLGALIETIYVGSAENGLIPSSDLTLNAGAAV